MVERKLILEEGGKKGRGEGRGGREEKKENRSGNSMLIPSRFFSSFSSFSSIFIFIFRLFIYHSSFVGGKFKRSTWRRECK